MSFASEVLIVVGFERVGGMALFDGERIGEEEEEEMSADRILCRAVAVRTARGLVRVVSVRIVRRKDWWGVGRFWEVRDVVRVVSVGGWVAIFRFCICVLGE